MGNDITRVFSSENRSDVAPISNGGSTDKKEGDMLEENKASDALYDVLGAFEFIQLPCELYSEQQYLDIEMKTVFTAPIESKSPTILTFMKKQRQKHKKKKNAVSCQSI